jgi:hypothetical protein
MLLLASETGEYRKKLLCQSTFLRSPNLQSHSHFRNVPFQRSQSLLCVEVRAHRFFNKFDLP